MVRLRLLGTFRVEKEGAPIRLRILQQAVLLAWLATAPAPLDRSEVAAALWPEVAAALWPEAERENGLAYLRRAIMELRRAGVEIVTPGSRLGLAPGSLRSDVDDLLLCPNTSSRRPA